MLRHCFFAVADRICTASSSTCTELMHCMHASDSKTWSNELCLPDFICVFVSAVLCFTANISPTVVGIVTHRHSIAMQGGCSQRRLSVSVCLFVCPHDNFQTSPSRVVLWLDHLDAMCSRAWRALCSAGSRFNSSRGQGKARPPT